MDFYHLLNRGVDKRNIFLDDRDRTRFVHGLRVFNDRRSFENTHRLLHDRPDIFDDKNREPLVDIHGWCLMNNHYHLLVSERYDGGITLFIRKLNIGYAKYFNERYSRSGTLFQGRTKKILIERDAHFMHILHYIHLNPLDYLTGAAHWRERRIKNAPRALNYLGQYPWSSYHDYIHHAQFPGITTSEFFGDAFGKPYSKALASYLAEIEAEPAFILE